MKLKQISYSNRTIVVIHGMPFYKSSGSNSGLCGTWLPFKGISFKKSNHNRKYEKNRAKYDNSYELPQYTSMNYKEKDTYFFKPIGYIFNQLQLDHNKINRWSKNDLNHDWHELEQHLPKSILDKFANILNVDNNRQHDLQARFGSICSMLISAKLSGGIWEQKTGKEILNILLTVETFNTFFGNLDNFKFKEDLIKTYSSHKTNNQINQLISEHRNINQKSLDQIQFPNKKSNEFNFRFAKSIDFYNDEIISNIKYPINKQQKNEQLCYLIKSLSDKVNNLDYHKNIQQYFTKKIEPSLTWIGTYNNDVLHDIIPQKKKVLTTLLKLNNKLKNSVPKLQPLIIQLIKEITFGEIDKIDDNKIKKYANNILNESYLSKVRTIMAAIEGESFKLNSNDSTTCQQVALKLAAEFGNSKLVSEIYKYNKISKDDMSQAFIISAKHKKPSVIKTILDICDNSYMSSNLKRNIPDDNGGNNCAAHYMAYNKDKESLRRYLISCMKSCHLYGGFDYKNFHRLTCMKNNNKKTMWDFMHDNKLDPIIMIEKVNSIIQEENYHKCDIRKTEFKSFKELSKILQFRKNNQFPKSRKKMSM